MDDYDDLSFLNIAITAGTAISIAFMLAGLVAGCGATGSPPTASNTISRNEAGDITIIIAESSSDEMFAVALSPVNFYLRSLSAFASK